jgi:hypothetical protein
MLHTRTLLACERRLRNDQTRQLPIHAKDDSEMIKDEAGGRHFEAVSGFLLKTSTLRKGDVE